MKNWLLIGLFMVAAAVGRAAEPKVADPYDESADGTAQVDRALRRARQEGKRVLLVFGANWCSDCRAMDALFRSDRTIAAALDRHYVVEKIDVGRSEEPRKNAALIERFGVAMETGIPAIVVVNADGQALNDTHRERLADTDHREPGKVLAFLKKWAP